jgi:1L-myo-inositol 1-phosphate cytidylyltransferase
MKCLIVAAGQGTRLREKGALKPLIPVHGVPLIERVVDGAQRAGVRDFYVVSGYRGDELRAELDLLAERRGVRITHVVNESWSRANGISVLRAKPLLSEPFLLTMCDHLVDPDIFTLLMEGFEPDTVTLAVDYNIENPLNDPEDVTRVKVEQGNIAISEKSSAISTRWIRAFSFVRP